MSLLEDMRMRARFHLWAPLRANRFSSYNLSHSQFGEDMVVRALFPSGHKGTYVDIGAHHPVLYSNTYHFYCRGWRGLNVDAAPGSMNAFRVLRPRDINIEACLGPVAGQTVTFHIFKEGAFNTTDPAQAERAQHDGATLLRKHVMMTVTLGELLAKHLPGKQIDLLSIDVEGLDQSILASNDWKKYKPRVVVFECHGVALTELPVTPVGKLLAGEGYEFVGKCGPSVIAELAGSTSVAG